MELTRVEKERISDSRMKIQAVAASLKHVAPEKLHDLEQMQECLDEADKNLSDALKSSR